MTSWIKLFCLSALCTPTLVQASLSGCPIWVFNGEDAILATHGGKYTSADFRSAWLVDIDNDQDLDLFVLARLLPFSYGSGDIYPMVYQFENTGDARLPDYHLLPRSVAYDFEMQAGFNDAEWEQLAFVDIDSDGDQDLFVSGLTRPTVGRNTGTAAAALLEKQYLPGLDESEYIPNRIVK